MLRTQGTRHTLISRRGKGNNISLRSTNFFLSFSILFARIATQCTRVVVKVVMVILVKIDFRKGHFYTIIYKYIYIIYYRILFFLSIFDFDHFDHDHHDHHTTIACLV